MGRSKKSKAKQANPSSTETANDVSSKRETAPELESCDEAAPNDAGAIQTDSIREPSPTNDADKTSASTNGCDEVDVSPSEYLSPGSPGLSVESLSLDDFHVSGDGSNSSIAFGCALPPRWTVGKDEKSHPPPEGPVPYEFPTDSVAPIAPLRASRAWTSKARGFGCSLPAGWVLGLDGKSYPPGRIPPALDDGQEDDEEQVEAPGDQSRELMWMWRTCQRFQSVKANGYHQYPKGMVGLYNFGNSCFMNSALQCLAQSGLLTAFFLSRDFEKEINYDNPIGHGGQAAIKYSRLLRQMWQGQYSTIAPKEFRMVMGGIFDMQQHDAQEYVNALLDALHEDLNLVKKKVPTPEVQSDGRPDEVVASHAWHVHLQRNKSFIVDMFYGQIKSRIACNQCDKVSMKFDPFGSLSLPMPLTVEVLFRNLNYDNPLVMYKLERGRPLAEMQKSLANIINIPEDNIAMRCVLNNVFVDEGSMDSFGVKIYAYQLNAAPELPESDSDDEEDYERLVQIEVLQCFEDDSFSDFVFIPIVLVIPLDLSTKALYGLINSYLPSELQYARNEEDTDGERWPTQDVYGFTLLTGNGDALDEDVNLLALHNQHCTIHLRWKEIPSPSMFMEYVVDDSVECRPRGRAPPCLSLKDCLNAFTEEEQLCDQNKWYCSSCKEHVPAFKSDKLSRLPRVVIFHLKRFSHSDMGRRKIDIVVDFPITDLDMEPYISRELPSGQSATYDLFAIIHHLGSSIQYGHYMASVKHATTGMWYLCDDDAITEQGFHIEPNASAYLLFYQLRE